MGDITMSVKERRRLEVLARVRDGEIPLIKATEWLRLSYRQAKRVWRRYREEGDKGLVHRSRGRVSGRSKGASIRQAVLELYKQHYWDFGPTLACEHLATKGYRIDHETLRRWLIGSGQWERHRRRMQHRQRRERKAQEGELVQMDGSEHDWFEGRGPRAVLMVMIDDATNRTYARFFEAETTVAAMDTFERYARRYGLPRALYVDLDSIYRVTREKPSMADQMAGQTRPITQFERAMRILGVGIVPAYSPQAKGRVERRNGVFQDRLVKELRLAGIDTLAAANTFLDRQFLTQLNRRFNVPAANPHDAHQPIPADINLAEVLSWEEPRTVDKDWTICWQNRCFQILRDNPCLPQPRRTITVRQLRNGRLQLIHKGQKLRWRELPKRPLAHTAKCKSKPVTKSRIRLPSKNNPSKTPWRKFGFFARIHRSPPTSHTGPFSGSGAPSCVPGQVNQLQPSRGHFKRVKQGDILKEL
jgi:Helix-turn-helix domain